MSEPSSGNVVLLGLLVGVASGASLHSGHAAADVRRS
jgi:hypothetical protein